MDHPGPLLILPYPPSANRLWRSDRGTAPHKSTEYKRWLEKAAGEILVQRPARIVGRYRLAIFLRPPDRRRRDIDNTVKPLSDALVQSGVIANDCLAQSVHAEWAGGPIPGGLVSILLTPFQELPRDLAA